MEPLVQIVTEPHPTLSEAIGSLPPQLTDPRRKEYQRAMQAVDRIEEGLKTGDGLLVDRGRNALIFLTHRIKDELCAGYHYQAPDPETPAQWQVLCTSGERNQFSNAPELCLQCLFFDQSYNPKFAAAPVAAPRKEPTVTADPELIELRERLSPTVREHVAEEAGLPEPRAYSKRERKGKRRGRINPALMQFDTVLSSSNLEKKVRRYVHSTPLEKRPTDVHCVARNILDEARVRIVQFQETPVDALSNAAVLNTSYWRLKGAQYSVLVDQARQHFTKLFQPQAAEPNQSSIRSIA
jgi:hypothetical protein